MKFSEIVAYFTAAAVSNKILAHNPPARDTFRAMGMDEILQDLKTDMVDITMVLESDFEVRPVDLLSDNKRKVIDGAFWVIKIVPANDFDTRTAALDQCELVTEQIIAKINNDVAKRRQNPNHPYALEGWEFNNFRIQQVKHAVNGWCGYRTDFNLTQRFYNNGVLKTADWINDTTFEI